MSDHAGFGWMLVVLGLVIAGVGLVWILAPSIPWLGRLPGDIRIERAEFPLLLPAGDVPAGERGLEPGSVARQDVSRMKEVRTMATDFKTDHLDIHKGSALKKVKNRNRFWQAITPAPTSTARSSGVGG